MSLESLPPWLLALILATGIYLGLIVMTRLMGLRSFSKLSSFDFAITVAIGSVVATVVLSKDLGLLHGLAGLGALYLLQFLFAELRMRFGPVARLIDNTPLMIMVGEQVIEDNLRRARMTRDDLYAKLREANVTESRQVLAVIVESTGDVSVLHADGGGELRDQSILTGVEPLGEGPQSSFVQNN